MARRAVIDGSTVVNIILAEPDFVLDGFKLITSNVAQIGWTYSGGKLTPPAPVPEPVPAEVADWQFAGQAAVEGIITRDEALAWAARGEVPATLNGAVAAAIPDPDALFQVRMLLSGAKSYLRDNPLVPLLGQVFGKDTAGLDQFWRDAAKRGV